MTQTEFKEIFNLDDNCKVTKKTIKSFINQIKGSYLLYLDLKNIKNKEFNTSKKITDKSLIDTFKISFEIESYIDFINNNPYKFYLYSQNKFINEQQIIKTFENIIEHILCKYLIYDICFSASINYTQKLDNTSRNIIMYNNNNGFNGLSYNDGNNTQYIWESQIREVIIQNLKDLSWEKSLNPIKNIFNEINERFNVH